MATFDNITRTSLHWLHCVAGCQPVVPKWPCFCLVSLSSERTYRNFILF